MPSSRQELLLNEFLTVVAERWRPGAAGPGEAADPQAATAALDAVGEAAAGMTEANRAQTQLAASYASVVQNSPVYQATQSGEGESTVARVASAVFKNALGMAPLARAVLSLFGGGGQEEPAPLVKYALPAAMRFEAATAGGTLRGMDYGQDGLPRAEGTAYAGAVPEYRQTTAANQPAPQVAPQVTIQVQAMDSRSFLDHKDDIARAVREAMLNMHSLNDVVSEL